MASNLTTRSGHAIVDTDTNPYCGPFTVMERIALVGIVCASAVTLLGCAGYLYARYFA